MECDACMGSGCGPRGRCELCGGSGHDKYAEDEEYQDYLANTKDNDR